MICRDVQFWDSVASHPQVAQSIFMGLDQTTLAPIIEDHANEPMASEHGGLIFISQDHLGFVKELHTLYTPEGWGREVCAFAKLCFQDVLSRASMIITYEQEGAKQTRPPLSFGWRPAGDYTDAGLPKRVKLWILTREAWVASPVGRKLQCQH